MSERSTIAELPSLSDARPGLLARLQFGSNATIRRTWLTVAVAIDGSTAAREVSLFIESAPYGEAFELVSIAAAGEYLKGIELLDVDAAEGG